MLIDFRVENFRSYKQEATLSMVASSDKAMPDNMVSDAHGTGYDILKSIAVYGANASGKSNLLKGIECMRTQVLNPVGQPIVKMFMPFVLDESMRQEPITMEVTFITKGIPYRYGFSVSPAGGQILEEWLHYFPTGRRRILFERKTRSKKGEVVVNEIKFGDDWKGDAKSLVPKTRFEALFISLAYSLNHAIANTVVDWFRNTLTIRYGNTLSFTLRRIHDDSNWKQIVTELTKKADLNIEAILTRPRDITNEVPPEVLKQIRKDKGGDASSLEVIEAETLHRAVDRDGKSVLVAFPLDEESDGTRKILDILGPVVHVLQTGSILVIDEFDLRLHPIIARTVVEMFHQEKTNPKGAQLVMTSHDVSLLDQFKLFRRDQIMLVDKNDEGGSELVSLWDYKVRNRENLFKGYLAGRYGAVPFAEVMLDQELFPATGN